MRSTRFIAVNALLGAVAIWLAALTLWPVYRSPAFLVLVIIAVALGQVIAICGALWRWSSIVVMAATIGCFLLAGVPLAVPSEAIGAVLPSGQGLLELISGAALGWKQLLTISIPVGSYQGLLVPAFILVLLGSVLTVTIALRARYREVAVLIPAALMAGGILFGPTRGGAPLPLATGFVVVSLLWLAVMHRWRRSASLLPQSTTPGSVALAATRSERRRARRYTRVRATAGAAAMVVLAAGVGIAATILLPPQDSRAVLRSSFETPFDPRAYISPLAGFRKYLEPEQATKTMLTVAGLKPGERIVIASLDTYDGVVYSVGSDRVASASGIFTRLPERREQSGVPGRRATLSVTVGDYSGIWLPGAGQLRQVTFSGSRTATLADSLRYNDSTGTSVVMAGLRAGDSYRMDAVVRPTRTAAELAGTRAGPAQLPKPEEVPGELSRTIARYSGGAGSAATGSAAAKTPGAKLAAALTGLAVNGYLSHGISPGEPASRSGHGADRISQLLTDVPMLGDAEQYAPTAALMARELGYPARVIVGFAPRSVTASGPAVVTGADISAWIEVQTAEDGWVAIDPNPPLRPVPDKQPDQANQLSRPQSIVQPPEDPRDVQLDQAPQSHSDDQKKPAENAFIAFLIAALSVTGWTLLVLAIVAAPFLTVIAAKARRRALRRSASSAHARISGGWQEFADSALDLGLNPSATLTRTELAELISTKLGGGMKPLVLASVADRAVFGTVAPTRREADEVWQAVGELRQAMSASATRWHRFRARVSLRSLGGYRGRTPGPGRTRKGRSK